MRRSRVIFWGALTACLVVATGCGGGPDPAWPGEPGTPRAEIVIDMVKAHYGRLPVTMRLTGIDGSKHYEFLNKATNEEYRYFNVRFHDGEGRPIRSKLRGNSYRLEAFEGDVVEASWETEPGGMGRHGMQGAIREDFASFDGRVFLVPRDVTRLATARIHFVLPWGWTAVTPFRQEGDWFYLDSFEPRHIRTLLENSCMGAGHFDVATRRLGEMEVRVGSYSGWDEEYNEEITEKTFRLLEYYHETFGFDLRSPYLALWTPKVNRLRVHGGSFINGTCLENPDGKLRPFQLLAHRVAHSMNKYAPATIVVGDQNGRWFREGWASYMEVVATEATGVAGGRSHYNHLFSNYKTWLASHPDLSLVREPAASEEGLVEFLHYNKGPLVVKMLAEHVEQRTGRTLEEFMRVVWNEHGWSEGKFALKDELEAWAGTTFDEFWRTMIFPNGIVVPSWDDYVTDEIRAGMNRRPAARTGARPVSGEYLHHLAASSDFSSFEEVRDFVVDEEVRRRQLEAAGVDLYNDVVREHLFAIPAEDRYAIARLEASYPLEEALNPERVDFEAMKDTRDGRIFAELLEMERGYSGAILRGPLLAMEVRADSGSGVEPRLAFGTDAALALVSRWRTPRPIEIEMSVAGKTVRDWRLDRPSPLRIDAPTRLAREGIVAFSMSARDTKPVTRGFWQRGLEPKRGPRSAKAARNSGREPDNPDAWYKDGVAESNAGRLQPALGFLAKAVEMDPADPKKWYKQGETLARMKRHEEAVVSFDEAVTLNPTYIAAAGNKAISLAELGRREESLAALDSLLEHNAESPLRFYWTGRVQQTLGDMEQAAKAYRTYTAVQPKWAEGWRRLGQVQLALKEYDKALASFDRVLSINPSDEDARRQKRTAQNALMR